MKHTKKHIQELESIRANLVRGIEYLKEPRIIICTQVGGGTTLAYHRQSDGTTIEPVNKEYGSNITGLYEALRKLDIILNQKET
jgi:hypothetical protein